MTILKFQNIKAFFAKGYAPNWSEEGFMLWTYVVNDLSGEEVIGSFYEK